MEKKLTVKFQKLLGSPVFPSGVFVEGQKFERLEGNLTERRGSLFSLVTLIGPNGFDAAVFGRAIFDTLEEEYFADPSLPPLPALEKAAFSAHRRLVGMTLSAHLGQSVDFNLVLAVFWGQVLYLCRLGSAAIYLLRDGKVSEVSMGDETLVTCASGFVDGGDTLILGSRGFRTHFPPDTMAESLLKLEERMQSLEEKATLAALVLKVEIEEYPGKDEALEFIQPAKPVWNLGRGLNVFRSFGKRLRVSPPVVAEPALAVGRGLSKKRLVKKILPPLVVVLLFAVFALSVYWTISRQSKLRLASLSQKIFAQADLDLVGATDLVGLSDVKAAEILVKTLNELQSLEKLGLKDPRLGEYQKRTRELLSKVSKETPVEKPRLVYDFSLAAKNIKATNLAGTKDNLFVGDLAGGGIYRLKINSQSETQRIDDGKITSVAKISAFADSVFAWDKSGVSLVKNKTGEVVLDVVPGLAALKPFDFASYNSNLYFLDPSASKIFRSLYGESGWAKPTIWLKEAVSLDKALNFALNGSLYVLLSDGTVLKFDAGKLSSFSLSGYSKTLSKNTFIYAGSGIDDIFLVDREGRKIVRFNDLGVYQKTYDLSGSEIGSLDSLYVSPETLNLYLLSGTKVYEVKP